jgi:hypothetical protein
MKIDPKTNEIHLEYPTNEEHNRETRAFEQVFGDRIEDIGEQGKPYYKVTISQP